MTQPLLSPSASPEDVCALLDARGVSYELARHPAVFHASDRQPGNVAHPDRIAKSLVLVSGPKSSPALRMVTVPLAKRLDLKALAVRLGCGRLRFASPERMGAALGCVPGNATPVDLLCRPNGAELVMDEWLAEGLIGCHPLVNTATVTLACADLLALLREAGARVRVLDVPGAA